MSGERLFDPAEFGVRPKPAKTRTPPDSGTVMVRLPWVVLRRIRSAPEAHLATGKTDDVVKRMGSLRADCGVFGMPDSELANRRMPACPRCLAAARKRGIER